MPLLSHLPRWCRKAFLKKVLARIHGCFQAWSLFDPDAMGRITTQKLVSFIRQLDQPLGAAVAHEKAPPERRWVQTTLHRMHRVLRQNGKQHRIQVESAGRLADGSRRVSTSQLPSQTSTSGYEASIGTKYAPKMSPRMRSKSNLVIAQRQSLVDIAPTDRSVGTMREAMQILAAMRDHLHDRDGIVLYHDVYFALLHRLMEGVPAAKLTDIRDEQLEKICKEKGLPSISSSAIAALAAVKLQSLVRGRQTRKRAILAKAELAMLPVHY